MGIGKAIRDYLESLTGFSFGKRPNLSTEEKTKLFYQTTAALLAKMAKADGVVTDDEIREVEGAFVRLGFGEATRAIAIDSFRKAKDDEVSVYDYARVFARAIESIEIRELVYEILWDIASADGEVSPNELLILQRIPRPLGIRIAWYKYFLGVRLGKRGMFVDPTKEAYMVLGVKSYESNEKLKARYHELARKYHPDALRAQGLPEEMIGKAEERMSRINAAWKEIREERGI